MDKKKLKQAAAALRLWIDENRAKHRRALRTYREFGKYRGAEAHEVMLTTRARLEYLVPMYRALLAASQQEQTVVGGKTGAKLYLTRFEAMQTLMQRAALYPAHRLDKKYFGDGLVKFPVLVPDASVSPLEWQFRTIGDLLDDSREALALEHQASAARIKAAADARKAFLATLNDAQRASLKAAHEAAKVTSVRLVTFTARELEAL